MSPTWTPAAATLVGMVGVPMMADWLLTALHRHYAGKARIRRRLRQWVSAKSSLGRLFAEAR